MRRQAVEELINMIIYTRKKKKKTEDLFTNLPTVITIDILSGQPFPTIMSCKLVCKSWRDLIESREFGNSHLAKSVPLLVVQGYAPQPYKVFKFIDDQVNPFCNKSFSFNFSDSWAIESSVDGLLLLRERTNYQRRLRVCNPITRLYIKIPLPPEYPYYFTVFGLGVSKLSREYKIFSVNKSGNAHHKWDEGYIYTLGTGCWRSIIPSGDDRLLYFHTKVGVFLNGNLHWLVSYKNGMTPPRIQCLDLETELSSTFSIPSPEYNDAYGFYRSLTALGGRLCFLGYSIDKEGIAIWLMKEYGDEKSWTREFVINENCRLNVYNNVYNNVYTGDYSLFWAKGYGKVGCFSTKTNTIRSINVPDLMDIHTGFFTTITYTPSFLPPLKSMVKEEVIN